MIDRRRKEPRRGSFFLHQTRKPKPKRRRWRVKRGEGSRLCVAIGELITKPAPAKREGEAEARPVADEARRRMNFLCMRVLRGIMPLSGVWGGAPWKEAGCDEPARTTSEWRSQRAQNERKGGGTCRTNAQRLQVRTRGDSKGRRSLWRGLGRRPKERSDGSVNRCARRENRGRCPLKSDWRAKQRT